MRFDSVLMVDWSGGNDRGPTPKKDAIWVCFARRGVADAPVYLRNRLIAEDWITEFLDAERVAGRRVLAGFDFAFGYPDGFGRILTGSSDPFAIWDWFEARIQDTPGSNNRFDLAGQINGLFPGTGPFWGNALKRDIADLPRKGTARAGHGMAERRAAEKVAKGAFPVWQLAGAGAVGSQVLMGLPVLSRLRRRFNASVWPFEPLTSDIVIAEIWPSLIARAVAKTQPDDVIKDAHQVWLLARVLSGLPEENMRVLLDRSETSEGSILGLGAEAMLTAAALQTPEPPALCNDCFAMPQGADWTPVDVALAHLRENLKPVKTALELPIASAAGRILAADVRALRSHPPAANAAVDGYGFAGPLGEGAHVMPLVEGRAAAGQPFSGVVPQGRALRILTGAILPDGVDTVVLQEDVNAVAGKIALHGPLKRGANARSAGEDNDAGKVILPKGRRLNQADIATAVTVGVGNVYVHETLRVGVLSTGDELRQAGQTATSGQIYDANRPMLLSVIAHWDYTPVDLGCAPDDRSLLRAVLDDAATRCDVVITTGGASSGEEDHISALLEGTGSFALWRVAVKPGRPLAMGTWCGVPVLGLPGNPVAAMVCALIFARPALGVMAGADWTEPEGYMLPAAFTKSKKGGRREYLRAKIADGAVTVFAQEGSGRVSSLSWATGLVELGDAAQEVRNGTLVKYIPFGNFGI